LKNIRERLAHLEAIVQAESLALETLEAQKQVTQDEIIESEAAIFELHKELKELQEILDVQTKAVEQVKRTTAKATKVLDQALKEIASMVAFLSCKFNVLANVSHLP